MANAAVPERRSGTCRPGSPDERPQGRAAPPGAELATVLLAVAVLRWLAGHLGIALAVLLVGVLGLALALVPEVRRSVEHPTAASLAE